MDFRSIYLGETLAGVEVGAGGRGGVGGKAPQHTDETGNKDQIVGARSRMRIVALFRRTEGCQGGSRDRSPPITIGTPTIPLVLGFR